MTNLACSTQKKNSSGYEKELLHYFIKCISSELSKIVIFSFIFYQLHLLPEFGAALLFLLLFRSCSGGLHCKNYISCLFVSFCVLFAGIRLGQTVTLPKSILLISTVILELCTYRLSPVLSSQRPPATESIIKHAKQRTLIISILLFFSLCFFQLNHYLNIGFWLFAINTLQLFTAYMIRRCQHVSADKNVNLVS